MARSLVRTLGFHLPALAAVLGLLAVLLPAPSARACDSCVAPAGVLAAPTGRCQYQAGATDRTCISDFWAVDLDVGTTYVFTFCPATCSVALASFDSSLRIWDPSCVFRVQNDSFCGTGAQITWSPLIAGRHFIEVASAGANQSGSYTLGYYKNCTTVPSCATPTAVLPDPTTCCQTLTTTLDCGNANFYTVTLIHGQTYTFTLCGATCVGAGANFDARVELYDPSGALVSSNGNACGDDGEIIYTADPSTGDGTYCIKIVQEAGTGFDYTFGWRVACQAPSDMVLSPLLAGADRTDCHRDQNFAVLSAGTPDYNYTFSIVPPAGGTATPPTGSGLSTSNAVRFSSRLQGAGIYQVTVTLTNECGSDTQTFAYELEDRAAPGMTLVAAPASCGFRGGSGPGPGSGAGAARALGGTNPPRLDPMAEHPVLGDPTEHAEAQSKLLALGRPRIPDGGPDVHTPPGADALSCGVPCTVATLTAANPFYEVFLACGTGAFTARTGLSHSVTTSSGSPQNVIYGGQGGSPGTSSIAWFIHDLGSFLSNPAGGRACTFDPPDTAAEPNSVGIEQEWTITPEPGNTITLREEMVAFGDTEANSGVRMTLSASSSPSSANSYQMGVRWQIDYQNGGDDGPLFATFTCDPPELLLALSSEHDLLPTEIADFYRMQNNTGSPIFANFSDSVELGGFPDTGTPDRLVYGQWGALSTSGWNYVANEGANADADSAVLYYFGHDLLNAIPLAPGDTFSRSFVIFTSGSGADCGGFTPGETVGAAVTICPGECARLQANTVDGCSSATAMVISTNPPTAPPCVGNPCNVLFTTAGTYVYTWEATDAAGNTSQATTAVTVRPAAECTNCTTGGVAPPPSDRICLGQSTTLDGSTLGLSACGGTVNYEWSDGVSVIATTAMIVVSPTTTTTYTETVTCSTDPACTIDAQVVVSVDQPPTFDPPTVRDATLCNLSLELSWAAATFHGPTATGVYNVYRSEISCADAVLQAPLATGLTVLRWVDAGTALGTQYFYVVEAEEDDTGSPCIPRGIHHGGEATRQCVGPMADITADRSTPDGVYATLFVRHWGQRIEAHWETSRALLPEEHFHLKKAWLNPQDAFVIINGEGSTARTLQETDTSAWLQFFDLRVANRCETESLREYPPG